jgi:ribosomal protein S18 acetylase RimI-like enzyme
MKSSDSYIITTYSGPGLPKQYRNLIYSKWLKSLRYGNEQLKMVDPKAFYGYHHLLIDDLLGRPVTHVRIASLEDDLDVVLGFCVCRPSAPCVIDYVYVNKDFRRQGLGSQLVRGPLAMFSDYVFTHLTKTGLTIASKKYPEWKYDPYR